MCQDAGGASGACSLRAAIDEANAWPTADTVTIAPGAAASAVRRTSSTSSAPRWRLLKRMLSCAVAWPGMTLEAWLLVSAPVDWLTLYSAKLVETMLHSSWMVVLLAIPILILAGCATTTGPMAMATLRPTTSSSTAQGTVHFQELGDGAVEVEIDLTGVPPGVHGFHVHEFGSCADSGTAAGGHFNPMNMPHASPEAVSHHAGDFGNVTAAANGEVHTRFTTRSITVSESLRSVVGKAVILHAQRDDLTSQPTGDAGGRIACGVVERHDTMP